MDCFSRRYQASIPFSSFLLTSPKKGDSSPDKCDEVLRGYRSAADGPSGIVASSLIQAYPHAKFILVRFSCQRFPMCMIWPFRRRHEIPKTGKTASKTPFLGCLNSESEWKIPDQRRTSCGDGYRFISVSCLVFIVHVQPFFKHLQRYTMPEEFRRMHKKNFWNTRNTLKR